MMRLLAIGLRLLAALCHLLPMKQRVALLSRQSGTMSMDFRLLAEELERTLGPQRVIAHTCDSELSGKGAFVASTFKQLRIAATTKVIVADGYLPVVCVPPKRTGCTVVQMWHAPGAIKKFGYQCLDTPAGRTSADARLAHMHEKYDYVIAGGAGAVDAFAEAFGYPRDVVRALGLPHFDYLLDSDPAGPRLQRAEAIVRDNAFFGNGKLKILYAPTLRRGTGYEGWLSSYVEQLVEQCPPDDADLIVAGHPLDAVTDAKLFERYPNLHVVPHTTTIDLLELVDCVISDYSTIALSAGLLGKPVLHFVPDIETYRVSPGLNVDVLEDERIVASANAQEIMRAALDCEMRNRAQEGYWAFTSEYFANDCTNATRRIAAFVADLL